MKELYEKRAFRSRNADEFDTQQVLDLFVDPILGLADPFGFENSIIKGRMGSGKTMFLRANHAYYLFGLVHDLLAGNPPVVPVLIKLNDFQHLDNPKEIYSEIIVKIIKGIIKAHKDIQSAERMAQIHRGIQSLPDIYKNDDANSVKFDGLIRLTSEEYKETIKSNFNAKAAFGYSAVEASANYEREMTTEIKCKTSAGIADVKDAYERILEPLDGKILILFDEAGSLDRSFFAAPEGDSLFETLMNQLRTAGFIRSKIAIYPNTPADILFETRYGDLVELNDDIYDSVGYQEFRKKALSLIERYLSLAACDIVRPHQIFSLDAKSEAGDAVEQIIYASGGNMRRLIQVLDQSMTSAFADHRGKGFVTVDHVFDALRKQSRSAESVYGQVDLNFLINVGKVCRSRSTYKFQFPYKSPALLKYVSKSEEFNVLRILDAGAGRKKTTYSFDYAYCVAHDIPTHYVTGTERIDRGRSLSTGEWIQRTAQISEELIIHESLLKKIEGKIHFSSKQSGYITGEDGKEYWFRFDDIMESGDNMPIPGRRVKFYPAELDGSDRGVAVELL